MDLTIYSAMADSPEWRIYRHDGGLGTEPVFSTTLLGQIPLNDIFRMFNRVTETDAQELEEMGYTLPSLSVGDVITIDGEHHMVAGMGFKPMTDDEYNAYRAMDNDSRYFYRRAL